MGGTYNTHRRERGDIHTKFWSENLKEREHSEEIGVAEKIILEWILGKYGGKV
jgi:hypothetical protein